jgi:hypothetical protein
VLFATIIPGAPGIYPDTDISRTEAKAAINEPILPLAGFVLRLRVLLETFRVVLKRNWRWRSQALFGLFVGLSLAAAAEAQTIGVPETPENPQLPSNVPTSVNPTPPIVGGVPDPSLRSQGTCGRG